MCLAPYSGARKDRRACGVIGAKSGILAPQAVLEYVTVGIADKRLARRRAMTQETKPEQKTITTKIVQIRLLDDAGNPLAHPSIGTPPIPPSKYPTWWTVPQEVANTFKPGQSVTITWHKGKPKKEFPKYESDWYRNVDSVVLAQEQPQAGPSKAPAASVAPESPPWPGEAPAGKPAPAAGQGQVRRGTDPTRVSIERQTALKAAVEIWPATVEQGISSNDILNLAQIFYDWLSGQQEKPVAAGEQV